MQAFKLTLCSITVMMCLLLNSCKKDNSTSTDPQVESTFAISGNEAVTENLVEDANGLLIEASISNNFAGRGSAVATLTMNNLSCPGITVTPAQGFPKNVTINFSTGCVSSNGIERKGIIHLLVSDSLRKPGSVSVMTFENYYVAGYKLEGTLTWTNTSHDAIKSWQRASSDGKLTASDGKYWMFSGTKNIIQTGGLSTPNNLLDDSYSITGQHTITNSVGLTGISTVIIPLEIKVTCANVDKGTATIEASGHVATVDFGDGTCDRIATLSIDGNPPRTILLR